MTAAAADFRWVLRRETASAHQALDDMVSTLDLGVVPDLARFFGMHLAAFRAMGRQSSDPRLADMIVALNADLAALGADAPVPDLDLEAVQPLAVDYILAGSRMGTKVLRKRWAASSVAQVRAARAYFTLAPDAGEWASTCNTLAGIATQSAMARQIIADSIALFDLFAESYARTAPATV